MGSKFVHMELSTTDPAKAVEFYKKLAGWKFQAMKAPDGSVYHGFTSGEGSPGGGVQQVQMPGQPSAWLPYLGVSSIKATVAKAKSLGATSVVDHMPIQGFGALGIVQDPTGAYIAFWEPAKKAAAASAKKSAKKPAAKKAAAKKAAPKRAAKRAPARKAPAKKRRR